MPLYVVKAKKSTLKANLSASDTTLTLTNLVDSKGNTIAMASFGEFGVVVVKQGDTVEIIKFDDITQNVNGSATLDVATSGRNISPITPYGGNATGSAFNAGAEVIVTNDPLTVMMFGCLKNANTWDLLQTFSTIPRTTGGNATDDNELVRYAQALALATGTANINRIVVAGNAGETITAGQLIYLHTDGEWYKCDADTAGTVQGVIIGIAQGAGTDGNPISSGVLLSGLDSNQTGLTNNTIYYASNTAGGISTSAGTTEVTVGVSRSTTSLLFMPRYNQQLTEDEQDALAGNGGTPSGTNKFGTQMGIQINAERYAVISSGSTTAYTCTFSPVPASLVAGMHYFVKIDVTNTTTTPTLNPNSLGATTIVKGVNSALSAGDLVANQIAHLVFDGTNFVLQNPFTLGGIFVASASENLKLSADTNRNNNNNGTVLVKSIRVSYGGIIRTKFDGQGNGFGGQGRIYVNGVAIGTTRSFANGSYTTYTEDITINASDLVQVYSIATGGAVTDIRNFRIYFDLTAGGDGTVITD